MSDRSRLRLVVLRVLVASILLTLLGRLAYLQVDQGAAYARAASDNRIRSVVTPAARGQVLDDRGVPLVNNRTALVVSVNRTLLHAAPHQGAEVLARLARVLGTSVVELSRIITPCGTRLPDGTVARASTKCWNGSPLQPVPVTSYSTERPDEINRVLAITEHQEDFPGVTARYEAVREYPQGSLAAHELGYLGNVSAEDLKTQGYHGPPAGAQVGRLGLEAVYDTQLRGVDGVQKLLVDKDSNVTGTLGSVPPKAGSDLVLSLDTGVQRLAEQALADGITHARTQYDKNAGKNYVAPGGAAIVVEVATGRLVAVASNPSYDPGLFVPRISPKDYSRLMNDPHQPLLSAATQGLYAPGSTFKIVSTAAAVTAGNSLGGTYPCPPSYKVGDRVFNNFEGETFGNIDWRTTLVKSCDTVYYKLAYDQWVREGGVTNQPGGKEAFPQMARAWGFGTKTGIDLSDERHGTITDRITKTKDWQSLKGIKCARATNGYPEVARTDPARAQYLLALAKEFCTDGYRYNAGDAVLFAIGQGDVLVTPLQLSMAYAALANGGTLFEPRLAKGLLAPDGSSATALPPVKRSVLPVSKDVLAYVRDALAGVPTQGGTAQQAFKGFPLGQLAIAGKTGTADVAGKSPTSWFASFAPAAAPRFAVVVMVPEGGTGGTTAAPIARAIYDGMYGLEGKKAVLGPGGTLPQALPVIRLDGSVGPPGTTVPARPATASPAPAPTTQALGPAGLPAADLPRRTTVSGRLGS